MCDVMFDYVVSIMVVIIVSYANDKHRWLAVKSPSFQGVTTLPNGDAYEGSYANGKRNGRGIYR